MTHVKLADYLTPHGGFMVCFVRYTLRPKSGFTSAKTTENKQKTFDLLSWLSRGTTSKILEYLTGG